MSVDLNKKTSSGLSVIQSNNLVSANYNLTITEQRIIYLAVARKNVFSEVERTNLITAKDFAKKYDMSPTKAYQRLKEASDTLYDRTLNIRDSNGEFKNTQQRWLSNKAVYEKGDGGIRISFAPEILEQLNDLLSKGEFTQVKLDSIIGMTNKYSIRLFTNMMRWKTVGTLKLTINDLRDMLELHDKYKMYADLKRKVLLEAIEEIEEHCNLEVKLTEKKENRKVVRIIIEFRSKKKTPLKIN